jgi:hypothetical protein
MPETHKRSGWRVALAKKLLELSDFDQLLKGHVLQIRFVACITVTEST